MAEHQSEMETTMSETTATTVKPTLTVAQGKVLDFITDYMHARRISPTLQEIADHLKLSRVTAFEHVRALVKKGWATSSRGWRSIRLCAGTCPCCGHEYEDAKP